MNIAGILFLQIFLAPTGYFVRSTTWVDDLTSWVGEESGARQVAFITELSENESISSRIVNEIFMKLMKELPALKMNLCNNLDQPMYTTSEQVFDDSGLLYTSSTFFLLLHESLDTPATSPSHRLIDMVARISSLQYQPKYLVVFIGSELSSGHETLLRYAWTKNLLDFTIVETVETQRFGSLRIPHYPADQPIVHRLNPFKNEYTRIQWGAEGDDLFPNKACNMYGYPLKVAVAEMLPLSYSIRNKLDELVGAGGSSIQLIEASVRALNASVQYLDSLESLEWNLISVLSRGSVESKYSSLRTVSIMIDGHCAVVPILLETKIRVPTKIVQAYVVSFGIVMIFWMLSRAMRFQTHVWPLININRVVFGVSGGRQPTRNPERIMFACLIAVSTIYSYTIYASTTDISLQTADEVKFESFEDLDRSGLTLIIHPFEFDRTFDHSKGALANLKSKTSKSEVNKIICADDIATYKNMSCIMDEERAKIAVERNVIGGRPTIKIAKPCFWSESRAFELNIGSYFRSSLDKTIMRMHSAGLIKRFYEEGRRIHRNQNSEYDTAIKRKQSAIALRQQLLAIVLVGYTLAFITFVAEIIFYAVSEYRSPRRLPVLHRRNISFQLRN